METVDLSVAPKHIATFIHQAQLALHSNRMKTVFGVDLSRHWIHSALQSEEEVFPIIVLLEVRSNRTKGGSKQVRVFLCEVRSPQDDEIPEGGYTGLAPWTPDQAQGSWKAVVDALKAAVAEVLKPPSLVKHQRGYLSFYGQRIRGVYDAAGWRLSTPVFPEDALPTIYSEQMVACERDVSGRSDLDVSFTFMSEMEKIALLLSVFWCTNVRTVPTEHRWVLGKEIVDGQFPTELRQLGFSEPLEMQKELSVDETPPVETRVVDRLNPHDYATSIDGFVPPGDGIELLQLFYDTSQSDPIASERFLSAAKAYHTSGAIWSATPTGAVAYLVVTAESLIEDELPTCEKCGQKVGVGKAMRELVFRELPGLASAEPEVKRLLTQAYEIRSKHFHAGRFAAGEGRAPSSGGFGLFGGFPTGLVARPPRPELE
jgi:hypothetical protein